MLEVLRNRAGLFLVLLLGVGLGFCFVRFAVVPQVKAYAAVREEFAAASRELARCRELAGSLRAERRHLEGLRAELAAVGAGFRAELRDGTGLIILVRTAAARRVRVTGVEPGPVVENKHTLALPMKITAEGNYVGVVAFCRDLEMSGLGNLAEIRSLRMEGLGEPGSVRATLDLVVYSDRSPEGRLALETLTGWQAGRVNVFEPVGSAAAPGGGQGAAADTAPRQGAGLPSAAGAGTDGMVFK